MQSSNCLKTIVWASVWQPLRERAAVMGVSSGELFDAQAAPRPVQRRKPNYMMLSPIVWAPIMYSMRHGLKGRVEPRTQHMLFFAATCAGLIHAGIVMSSDSTV